MGEVIGAVRFSAGGKHIAKLYQSGSHSRIDWGEEAESGLDGLTCYGLKADAIAGRSDAMAAFAIVEGVDGSRTLRINETARYVLEYEPLPAGDTQPAAVFQNEGENLKCDRNGTSVSFQFVNYLGRSRIRFGEGAEAPMLPFEVVPLKMGYEDDYIELTEELAGKCAALLLDYSGSTSNAYRLADESSETLLEQFVFLRQFCYENNLQALFEAIKRNPDRTLDREEELRPAGIGLPSRKFYTTPFSNSRAWMRLEGRGDDDGTYLPLMVNVTRKFDCLDTPANRFIKFALQEIDRVCTTLMAALDKEKGYARQTECYREASALHDMLDGIFADAFFDDIGTLQMMPQNNQVLQKREGYSQIFSAYSMMDLALQLDWKGKDDVYEGESKNVALLYEYWLFFELFDVIRGIEGCRPIKTDDHPFLGSDSDSALTIALKQGVCSRQCFEVARYGAKVNLYYNRTFSPRDFQATRYEGSYSRPFRPDYTLAIFPSIYASEKAAVGDGAVVFVHFDAKYRISDLTGLVGKDPSSDEAEREELDEEKANSTTNTYKRGDLLKMHTYNDAIRRTIGSYVLYPGSDEKNERGRFRLFEEILPGVGAFAIKPSISQTAEDVLRGFIEEVISTNAARSTRLNRLSYFTEMVVNEPSSMTRTVNTSASREGNAFIIGYIRDGGPDDYYRFLESSGRLNEGGEFPFYFYAIKEGHVYSHHKDLFRTTRFRFYRNAISETGIYELEPVLCRVTSNELVSKDVLADRLAGLGYVRDREKQGADYYYVLTMQVEHDAIEPLSLACSEVDGQNGNDAFSPHSPKLVGKNYAQCGEQVV